MGESVASANNSRFACFKNNCECMLSGELAADIRIINFRAKTTIIFWWGDRPAQTDPPQM